MLIQMETFTPQETGKHSRLDPHQNRFDTYQNRKRIDTPMPFSENTGTQTPGENR